MDGETRRERAAEIAVLCCAPDYWHTTRRPCLSCTRCHLTAAPAAGEIPEGC